MASSSLKRAASPEISTRPSQFHSAVTLYTLPNEEDEKTSASPSRPRRSKRIKIEESSVTLNLPSGDSHVSKEESKSTVKRTKTEATSSSSSLKLEDIDDSDVKPLLTKSRSKASTPRKPKVIKQSLETPHAEPDNWREVYDTIKRMRSTIVAPVDTMGCEQAQYKEKDPKNQRFATLVSLMLSSQTKDEVTDAAMSKLREGLGGSLSIDAVIQSDEATIAEAIAKVGFWRRKTQYIRQTAQRLKDDFDSDVPKTVDELCSLPGVGPKMAFLALHVAWKINVGIGVDVHVHRITNRLGWHKPPTKTPEETRLNLQSWLPTELHPEINHLLVGFGQVVCLPVGPRCDGCELSGGLCPSANLKTKTKTKTRKAIKSKDSGPQIEIALETSTEETGVKGETFDPPSPLTELDE